VRLPVDAKLTTDQVRLHFIDWLLEDDRSNIMHPTSEGHAAHAEANVEEIRRLIEIERQQAEPD
jgi:hypothetical protein